MRIAIVTLALHTNYGGILQAYALQTVLQRMGHDVHHLQPKVEFPPLHPAWQMPFVWVKRLIRKCFLGEWRLPIFENPYQWMRKYTDAFIQANISIRFLQAEEWNESLAKEYDAFVVGSDQVWRSFYAYPLDRYFLSFLGDLSTTLRIAYAASFGTEECDFTLEQIQECRVLLQRFSFVSVREKSGVQICTRQFGVSASQVLDPTLLLLKEDYLRIVSKSSLRKGNLLVYVLDETSATDNLVKKIAISKGLTPFRINSKIENHQAKVTDCLQPPVEQWIRGFLEAKFVITDSFHACVFAIIFNRPFICIGNDKRGMSRFQSLLDLLELQQCMVTLDQSIEIPSIDWDKVNLKLEKLREYSLSSLKQTLSVHKKL